MHAVLERVVIATATRAVSLAVRAVDGCHHHVNVEPQLRLSFLQF
jgi:hypothetical protein